jgi:hypothetical protein
MFEYLRNCVLALSCVALPALACSPSSEYKPPSVEQIFAAVTYVVYAEAIAYEESVGGRRAQVSVIEQFKGPPVKSIGASGQGCGLSIYIGETRIFFLDSSANGHVMAYPIGKSDEEILQELRALVAKDKADSVGLKTM